MIKSYGGNIHFVMNQEPENKPLHELSCILMRKDPPFDMEYVYSTYILELAEQKGCLVVNKPSGIVVHPAFGNFTGTLVHALMYHTENLSDYNSPDRPGIVHRLDKDTSGLLLVAKDPWVHAQLAKQFSNACWNGKMPWINQFPRL